MGTPYYWSVNLQGIGYDGVYIDKVEFGDYKLGIMDTGTPLIHLPKRYHNMLVEMWKEQLGYDSDAFYQGASGLMEGHGDCSKFQKRLSNFTVIFGDYLFDITPEAYLMNCTDLPASICSVPNNCAFGIDSMDTELGAFQDSIFLLGNIFLKNFYAVYRADNTTSVDLALAKHYQH